MSQHGRQESSLTLSPRPRPLTADITPSLHRSSFRTPPTSPHADNRELKTAPRPSVKFKAKADNKDYLNPFSLHSSKATVIPRNKMVAKSAMKPPKKTGRRPVKGIVSKANKPTAVTKRVPSTSAGSLPVQKLTLKLNNRGTTKSGREVKRKEDPYAVTGEEYDDFMRVDSSSPLRVPAVTSSYTPTPHTTLPVTIDPYYDHNSSHYPANIDNSIFQLADTLRDAPDVQVELPDLEDDNNPDDYKPWTAKQLVHLYLVCYHREQWNGCDLIADTWIRALQKANARHDMKGKMWKPNQATNYNPVTSKDYTDVEDPILDASVFDFDQDRINELFFHTNKKCGARFLWADAMALCGSVIEDKLEKAESLTDRSWHKDLVWEIMKTSLRLVRTKLTLKIEEKTPSEWCRRYHEHGRNRRGLPCYRDLRRIQELARENGGDGGAVQPVQNGKRKVAQSKDMVRGGEESSDEDAEGEIDDTYQPSAKRVNFQDPKLAWDTHHEEVASEEE